jgi:periodic tryptophan protein 2
LNSKNLGDGGPINVGPTNDSSRDVTTYNAIQLPGAERGDDGSLLNKKIEVRTLQVAFASTGREWGVISEEGLHIYSLDDDMIFDPISMNEVITPASIEKKLSMQEYSMALRMALYLNEFHIIQNVLEQIPYRSIAFVCRSIPHDKNGTLETLLQVVAKMIDESPHVEFYIQWCLEILQIYGLHIERSRNQFMRVLRTLHKAILSKRMDVNNVCNENKYILDFIESHASSSSSSDLSRWDTNVNQKTN